LRRSTSVSEPVGPVHRRKYCNRYEICRPLGPPAMSSPQHEGTAKKKACPIECPARSRLQKKNSSLRLSERRNALRVKKTQMLWALRDQTLAKGICHMVTVDALASALGTPLDSRG